MRVGFALAKIKATTAQHTQDFREIAGIADLTPNLLFPYNNAVTNKSVHLIRQQNLNDNAVIYIGAYAHSGYHSLPFGVYIATSLNVNIQTPYVKNHKAA